MRLVHWFDDILMAAKVAQGDAPLGDEDGSVCFTKHLDVMPAEIHDRLVALEFEVTTDLGLLEEDMPGMDPDEIRFPEGVGPLYDQQATTVVYCRDNPDSVLAGKMLALYLNHYFNFPFPERDVALEQ